VCVSILALSLSSSLHISLFLPGQVADSCLCVHNTLLSLSERATNCGSRGNFIRSESSPYPDFNMAFSNWRRFWEIYIEGSQNHGFKTNQTISQSNNPVTYQLPILTAFKPGFMNAVFNYGRHHEAQVGRNCDLHFKSDCLLLPDSATGSTVWYSLGSSLPR